MRQKLGSGVISRHNHERHLKSGTSGMLHCRDAVGVVRNERDQVD